MPQQSTQDSCKCPLAMQLQHKRISTETAEKYRLGHMTHSSLVRLRKSKRSIFSSPCTFLNFAVILQRTISRIFSTPCEIGVRLWRTLANMPNTREGAVEGSF